MADPLEADGSAPILKPVTAFEDNLRPAKLMLQVYRLLECGDKLLTDGQFVDRLRAVVKASAGEDLIVLQNEIFLGLVRERAGVTKARPEDRHAQQLAEASCRCKLHCTRRVSSHATAGAPALLYSVQRSRLFSR